MPRVQRLDPLVAERIAAGEVVERPSSVVKELVENSLDAGATSIQVELVNGGVSMLRVTDDGCGMSHDDLRLALERFATSKIRAWEDLDTLDSLGFRGEALPSVAAVSRLEIQTSEPGAPHGTLLRSEGGVVIEDRPAPPVGGTRVTVSDLFFNTPARLKFLKSAAAETSQVVDLLGRLAMTRPGVHFSVKANGRDAFLISGASTLAQRLAQLWKLPLDELLPLQGEAGGVAVSGWAARPQHARATRTHQLFSLNGRVIRSSSLSQALSEGFGPLLPRGRFPVALVALVIDPASVDVNVHPTKAEVRFVDARSPFRAVYRSCMAALESGNADPVQPSHWRPGSRVEVDSSWELIPAAPALPPPLDGVLPRAEPAAAGARKFAPAWRESPPPYTAPAAPTDVTLDLFRPLELQPAGPRVRVLAQLYRTFIVAEVEGELWVVDQHTAHERLWYERLGGLQPLDGPRQGLLVPEVLEVAPAASAWLEGHAAMLSDFGFELEPFGHNSWQLRSLPSGLKPKRAPGVLLELIEAMAGQALSLRNTPEEAVREKLRAMVSCKAAIKAGESLSDPEMESLIRDMLSVEHSTYCPHGRPTRVKLDSRALERLFHR